MTGVQTCAFRSLRGNELVTRVGATGAHQLWDYLRTAPDEQSPYGCVCKLKGAPKGSIPTWYYEVFGAGRVDFQIDPAHGLTAGLDPHPTVFIIDIDIDIDYGSH